MRPIMRISQAMVPEVSDRGMYCQPLGLRLYYLKRNHQAATTPEVVRANHFNYGWQKV